MSTRAAAGRGRRDRPRTVERKGKDRGDKASTPTQEAVDETAQSVKSVIWNDEIEALRITDERLVKVHSPRPPSGERGTPKRVPLTVRKLKPPEVLNRPKPKTITIAKPAPLDVPARPMDFSHSMGPRFDENGRIVSHSILGSVEGFLNEAEVRGEFVGIGQSQDRDAGRAATPSLKYEKSGGRARAGGIDEHKALKNWTERMRQRKLNQGYISRLVGKPTQKLAMSQSDQFRRDKEEQHLIDRTIPLIDYGKGYRVGSEFWKQQEPIGDEMTGLHMTLSQTEKGFPPPVEFIGMPQATKYERGVTDSPPSTPLKPWHRTEYLRERQDQLAPYISELAPHRPEFEGLAVVGSNRPYMPAESQSRAETIEYSGAELDNDSDIDSSTDVTDEIFIGPSLKFGASSARWTGDSTSHRGKLGAEARVSMETDGDKPVVGHLDVKNDGSTSIYFKWKKLHKDNPFSVVHAPVQRFYFDTSAGVILPGDTHRFVFVFKSSQAGVYTERWQLETAPVVAGGAALVVALKGISLQPDTYKQKREQINSAMKRRKAELEVGSILEDLLSGVKTPERPSSPIDAYLTPEEKFRRNNPALHFSGEPVRDMLEMYVDLCPEEADDPHWDQSVNSLKDMILSLDEDDPRKESMLNKLNVLVASLSYPPGQSLTNEPYRAGYQVLAEMVDSMVSGAMQIRSSLGLSEKDEYYPEDSGMKGRSRLTAAARVGSRDATKTAGSSKPATAAAPLSRAATQSKLDVAKDQNMFRAAAAHLASAHRKGKRNRSAVKEDENPDDPVLAAKYRESLTSLTNTLLQQTVDRLVDSLSELPATSLN